MSSSPDEPGPLVFDDWYRRELPRVRQALTLAIGGGVLAEEAADQLKSFFRARRSKGTPDPAGR